MGIAATETTANNVVDGDFTTEVTVDVSLQNLTLSKPVPLESKASDGAAKASSPVAYTFADAKLLSPTKVEVTFSDGSTWLFHSAWLLDSCRAQVSAARKQQRHANNGFR